MCKSQKMERIKFNNLKIGLHSKFGVGGIALCGICCALPLISGLLGIGSLTAFGYYLDKVGIIMVGVAVLIFLYSYYKKRRCEKLSTPSCEFKGCCSTNPES
jgi:hypothetical protein